MKKIIKLVLIGIVIILIVISLPGAFSNSKRFNQAEKDAQLALNEMSKICSSNCTDYPSGWVIKGKEAEAELYCMRQCSNNMQEIRKEMIDNITPTLFKNKYSYNVEQVYCILGLVCHTLEIKDFIYGYKP